MLSLKNHATAYLHPEESGPIASTYLRARNMTCTKQSQLPRHLQHNQNIIVNYFKLLLSNLNRHQYCFCRTLLQLERPTKLFRTRDLQIKLNIFFC